jgi:putative flippase GtrA
MLLERLRSFDPSRIRRIMRFAVVGLSGVGVNMGVTLAVHALAFDSDPALVAQNIASVSGTLVSIFTNFLLNDGWTWGDRPKGDSKHWWRRVGKYYVTASVGLVIEWTGVNIALQLVTQNLMVAKAIGIVGATASNFLLMHFWAFK